jgi:uncharacterized membrane protein
MKQATAFFLCVLLLSLTGCSSASKAASRATSVCNNVNATIHVAVAYHVASPEGWTSKGWTDVAPGACAQVIDPSVAGQSYFEYAYISNDKTTNQPDWGGHDYFCLAWDPSFTNTNAKDNSNCTRTETQNEEWVGFYSVDATAGQPTSIHY